MTSAPSDKRSTRHRRRGFSRLDAGRVRLFPGRHDADRGPVRAEAAPDDRPRVLLGDRGAHRLRAELHGVPRAPGIVWDRNGSRVGRWRLPGHGKGLVPLSGRRVGSAAAGICPGIPARGAVLSLALPPSWLAAAVFHRRPAGVARAVRAHAGEGVGGVARDPARELERARSRDPGQPPAVRLHHRADVDDEHGVARDAGHVSHVPPAPLGVHGTAAGRHHDHLHGGGPAGRRRVRSLLGRAGSAARHRARPLRRRRRDSPVGVRSVGPVARSGRFRDAVLRPGRVGCDSGAYQRALPRRGTRLPAGVRLPMRRGPGGRDRVVGSALRRASGLRVGHGPDRGNRVHPRDDRGATRPRAPGSSVRARRSLPLGSMTTFVKATQAYQQGQRTLPGRYYNAPEIWAEERERIFARRWICVGRAAELGQPGDYTVRAVGGESVMVVRGQDGAVRAFYNVCRHRGTRLCETERGRLSETIQCPYHAWTYTLDGTLIGAPHMNEVAGFDKRDYPLHQVALAEWEGFLFINLAQEPEPFARAFAPLAGRFSRFNIAKLRSGARIEYDVHANWKLVFQNYSECLHCPIIHPGLAKLTPYTSGENDLFDGPYLGGYMVITAPGGSLTMSGRACGPAVGDLPLEDQNRVYFYTIFPNLLLSLHPDYVMFHTLWPQAPDRTHITCEWLFHPDAFGQPGFDPDDAVRFWDETNRQDWHICEQSHAGIASRAYQPGPYSPREGIVAAWDREFLRALEGGKR